MVRPGLLRQLHDLDRTSPQFYKRLSDLLHGNEYQNSLLNLQGEDLAWLIQYLDGALTGVPNRASIDFKGLVYELRKACNIAETLRGSCVLPLSLLDGFLLSASEISFNSTRLRIKRVRVNPDDDQQKVERAVLVWKHLSHPNVVILLGVTANPLQLISGWIPGGNMMEYTANHSGADREALLSDVAEGLNYLHSCTLIHGCLRGSNILVDDKGRAQITDFGISALTQNPVSIQDASAGDCNSARWMAPEVLDGRGTHSPGADVFSFAMVTIEVFTCAVPFSDRPPQEAAMAIVRGERPPWPVHSSLKDGFWALIQQCWHQEAHCRPQLFAILRDFGAPICKLLINCPLSLHARISLITAIFSDDKETEMAKGLDGDDAQTFIDVMDETLDALALPLRMKCRGTLRKMCGHRGLLPRSVKVSLSYDRTDNPLSAGGYADVWKGDYQGCEVAIKVLRVCQKSDIHEITRRFCREVMAWKTLCHQNVLPLFGVTMGNGQFAMASEWMIHGNINEFIKVHRDVDRFELLKDVAQGLIYMHHEGMVHGDLKGANILIDRHERARIADFGLAAIVADNTTTNSLAAAGTIRWMSPERVDPNHPGAKDSQPTRESDCYALGMVILEVLSGEVPFTRDCNTWQVGMKITNGEHPKRPQGEEGVWFTDDLWKMLQVCWSPLPSARPSVDAVLDCLVQVSTAPRETPPPEMTPPEVPPPETALCETRSTEDDTQEDPIVIFKFSSNQQDRQITIQSLRPIRTVRRMAQQRPRPTQVPPVKKPKGKQPTKARACENCNKTRRWCNKRTPCDACTLASKDCAYTTPGKAAGASDAGGSVTPKGRK